MHYHWNKRMENLPEEMTAIWSCTNDDCNGWMRDSYSFDDVPSCPQCKSAMIKGAKMLPILLSSAEELKQRKKMRETGPSAP